MKLYMCEKCGASGVKLWRPSEAAAPLLCFRCVPRHGEIARALLHLQLTGDSMPYVTEPAMIPAVQVDGGNAGLLYNYGKVPRDVVDWWNELPCRSNPPAPSRKSWYELVKYLFLWFTGRGG